MGRAATYSASRPTGREPLFGNLARPGTRPVQRRCGAREWRAGPIEPSKQRDGHSGSRSPAPIALAKTPGGDAAGLLVLARALRTRWQGALVIRVAPAGNPLRPTGPSAC